jgi:hypothetical protein
LVAQAGGGTRAEKRNKKEALMSLLRKLKHYVLYRFFIHDFFAFCKEVLLSEATETTELIQKLRAEC